MERWTFWNYRHPDGRWAFQTYKITDPSSPRGKRYGFRHKVHGEWVWEKPACAAHLLYGIEHVALNPRALLVLTEGEADADTARGVRTLAASHSGGAGKFTTAQAESLTGHRGPIWLVADNDPAGARDVCQRYDTLRAVGFPSSRLSVRTVRPPHAGADLRDHLEDGYLIRELEPADLGLLREVADTDSREWFDGSTPEGDWPSARDWRPQIVARRGT